MAPLTVAIPAAIEPFLIGLWRFREAGKLGAWMATYVYRGNYFDARGQRTPQSAIDAVAAGVARLRRRASH